MRSDGAVTIRPLRINDAAQMCAAVVESVVEVGRWLPWCHEGYTLEEAASFIELSAKGWADKARFVFGIFDTGDDVFLGTISINHIVATNRLANLGYWVRTLRTRQGIALAAARLVARFAFEELRLTRLEIVCIPENLPSRRVAEKIGSKLEAISRDRLVMHGKSYDAAVYSLLPTDLENSGVTQ